MSERGYKDRGSARRGDTHLHKRRKRHRGDAQRARIDIPIEVGPVQVLVRQRGRRDVYVVYKYEAYIYEVCFFSQ